jgi:pimeloyl-ACP methyl ester carboxylesterase
VLLISGAGDHRYTASYAELAAELGVEHRAIPGCGHNPVLEAPEITARAIVARGG